MLSAAGVATWSQVEVGRDKQMQDGADPLLIAAQDGHHEVVRFLSEAVADEDPDLDVQRHRTRLMIAAKTQVMIARRIQFMISMRTKFPVAKRTLLIIGKRSQLMITRRNQTIIVIIVLNTPAMIAVRVGERTELIMARAVLL